MKSLGHIFRSYDIRGLYKKELTPEVMEKIGRAAVNFDKRFTVGVDVRPSGKKLVKGLISGLKKRSDVDFIGMVPMGVGLFHAWQNGNTLAFVTASHLPKEWNGVKFFHKTGHGFSEEENFSIRDRFLSGEQVKERAGKISEIDNKEIIISYVNYLTEKIQAERPIKIALDPGNGAASLIVSQLFEEAGFNIKTINEEPDGSFPNRKPDPKDEYLDELKQLTKGGYDLGIGYDGDGDRMILVDETGKTLTPEQTTYFILTELLKKEKGPIVANVECTRMIDDIARKFSRKVIRVKVGHTYLVEGVHKHNACFGVEVSGHYCIPKIVPYDDALAISLYAAQALSKKNQSISTVIKDIKEYPFERISFDCPDDKKFDVIKKLQKKLSKDYKNTNTMDGIRIDFENGWVLIRASNTGPVVRLTVEGDSEDDFQELKNKFSEILKQAIEN